MARPFQRVFQQECGVFFSDPGPDGCDGRKFFHGNSHDEWPSADGRSSSFFVEQRSIGYTSRDSDHSGRNDEHIVQYDHKSRCVRDDRNHLRGLQWRDANGFDHRRAAGPHFAHVESVQRNRWNVIHGNSDPQRTGAGWRSGRGAFQQQHFCCHRAIERYRVARIHQRHVHGEHRPLAVFQFGDDHRFVRQRDLAREPRGFAARKPAAPGLLRHRRARRRPATAAKTKVALEFLVKSHERSPATGTVTLSTPAFSGGATVILSSSSWGLANPPSQITVPEGATTATFNIGTSSVSQPTPVTITGSYAGITQTATLTIEPPSLGAEALGPASVTGGSTSTGTVTLNQQAPAGGIVVSLSSSDSTVADVPATVTVPQWATSASFTVTTSAVAQMASVTITASSGGATQTVSLTVAPPTINTLTLDQSNISG